MVTEREKRQRDSSSDYEDQQSVKPKPKLRKTSDHIMATVNENPENRGITEMLNQKLQALITGQEQLHDDMNNNFVRISENLAKMIDSKLTILRSDINEKFIAFNTELQDVKLRVQALETQPVSADGVVRHELTDVQRRHESMEWRVSTADPASQSRAALIVKGLPETNDETDASLLQACDTLLKDINAQARAMTAELVGTDKGNRRRPRLIKMAFLTEDDAKDVMRNKGRLKDSTKFSSVYIEPDRPTDIRVLEANVLTKELPDLEYRRGRVQPKGKTVANGPRPH